MPPPQRVIEFNPFVLKKAVFYHLFHHYSFLTHLNHLFFLNTYVFGIFLMFSCISPIALIVITSVYSSYCALLLELIALPYVAFLFGLAYGAFRLTTFILVVSHWAKWELYILSAGIILLSFIAQLSAHYLFEVFHAPLCLSHGLFAAPPLEYASMMFRFGRTSLGISCIGDLDIVDDMWKNLDRERRIARLSLSNSL